MFALLQETPELGYGDRATFHACCIRSLSSRPMSLFRMIAVLSFGVRSW